MHNYTNFYTLPLFLCLLFKVNREIKMPAEANNVTLSITLPKLSEFTQDETWLDIINLIFLYNPDVESITQM